jgi:4-hydroxybutyryl-CoA dehydratase/vinylacetyl-CoA-Delta-isomerase
VVQQNKMQRRMGQLTGTCFQRCVGIDAIAVLHSSPSRSTRSTAPPTTALPARGSTELQRKNLVVGAGMTDPKGDRSKRPQRAGSTRTCSLHVTKRRPTACVITRREGPQTGGVNSHWICVMPTMNACGESDRDYAVVAAVPVDVAKGITYIYGRQSCDSARARGRRASTRATREFGGQEVLIIFDDVFVPNEHVFMDGEYEFAQEMVARFTAYHRASYVCKTGLGDVLIGAAAAVAEYNGVEPHVSHIRDKLVEMTTSTRPSTARASRRRTSRSPPSGQLHERRHAGERVQAQRHALPLRAGAAGAGPGRRPDGHLPSEKPTSRTPRRGGPILRSTCAGAPGVPTESACACCA